MAIAAAVVFGGLALGLGVDIVRQGGLTAWIAARGLVAPAAILSYDARGHQVDIGGHSVYLDCRGTGSPTVVLEAGAGGGAENWGPFLDEAAALTRTCAWDRPGLGRSASIGLHSGADTASDLHSALAAAGETGPFIVVAHSFGGMYARLFASTAPGSVVAFLMLDIYEPDLGIDQDPALRPELRATLKRNLEEGNASLAASEQLDWPATLGALEPITKEPADLLMVDQHGRYVDPDPAVTQALVDAWTRAFTAHYPKGRIEIVPTSHFVHLDRPDLVLDRLHALLNEARGIGG